ncbi:MAG: type VI secretion system tip protein TssI/VgrG [Pyrinomonadaceae bacterium]
MAMTQEGRLLKFTSPLGEDVLLLNKIRATEGLSQLYEIDIELMFDQETDDGFDVKTHDITKILGQSVTISIDQPDDGARLFLGTVCRFTQLHRDRRFTYYGAKIVPHIWKLTQNFRSRIFQQMSVPDILKKVLEGYEIKDQLKAEYKPRNYCAQYRESDFDFISRLMEDEGIYYYFDHSGEKEKMVLRDDYLTPEDCPNKSEIPTYDIDLGRHETWESNVKQWFIDYNLISGSYETWDYQLQMPGKKLDANMTSRFSVGGNQDLKIYNYPGGYGGLYDGIDKSGGEQTDALQKIFDDNKKNAKNTMLSLDSQHQIISATSDCCSLTAGYRFTLKHHPNDEFNISYVVTTITHEAEQIPDYEVGDGTPKPYANEFTCIPHGDGHPEYRPERRTPKPLIYGSQTAFVVGPEGEEIFTDKYGRVKVQFHWDQDGQLDASSSCWVPVSQGWAGNKWGMVFIPRIGMEVIVSFLDGDPDHPIVKGCVYNPGAMPPYDLPDEKTKSTIKSDSSKGGNGFNEIRLEDLKDSEQIFVHGEKDIDVRNKNDRREWVGNDHHYIIKNDRFEKIERDEHRLVERHQYEEIRKERHTRVGASDNVDVGGSYSLKVGNGIEMQATTYSLEANGGISLKSAAGAVIDAPGGVTLKCGASFVALTPGGVDIVGPMVKINSGGGGGPATAPSIVSPTPPEEPDEADDAKPGTKIKLEKRSADRKEKTHKEGNEEKKSWVKIKLVDEEGKPVTGVSFKVTTPDGRVASGSTNKDGQGEVKNIDPGNCKITFPDLDKDAWEEA